MLSALPWLKEVWSTGWNEVSFRLSNPTPNSIWGTEQEPKSPMDEDAAPEDAAAPVVEFEAVAPVPVELEVVALVEFEAVAPVVEFDAVAAPEAAEESVEVAFPAASEEPVEAAVDAVTVTVTISVHGSAAEAVATAEEVTTTADVVPLSEPATVVAVAPALLEPAAAVEEPSTPRVTPWSFTTGTAAKFVLIPKTPLKASA